MADSIAGLQTILNRELAAKNPHIIFIYKSSLGNVEYVINSAISNQAMATNGVSTISYGSNVDTRLPGYNKGTIDVTYG